MNYSSFVLVSFICVYTVLPRFVIINNKLIIKLRLTRAQILALEVSGQD